MSLVLLIIAFVFTGLCSITSKALVAWGLGDYIHIYLLAFYGVPALLGAIGMRIRPTEVSPDDRKVGFSMGLLSAISMLTFLFALELTTAVVAFPVRSVACLLLTCAISIVAWRERLSRVQWLGIGVSIAAIWLIC